MSQPICYWCSDRIRNITRLGTLIVTDGRNFHRGCVLQYKAQKVIDERKQAQEPKGRKWLCPMGGHYHYDKPEGGDP